MSANAMFLALALASACGTVWVYWGVPRRVVANWAIGMGSGYAILSAILWFLFTGPLETPPAARIVGGVFNGAGIAFGGLMSHVLYCFNRPIRRDGA